MRQTCTHDDERQPLLGQLVTCRAQRGDVGLGDVLHLVDEDGDPDADVAGDAGCVDEQFDQVDLDVAGVGAAGARGHVDARLPPLPELRAPSGADRRAKAFSTPRKASTRVGSRCRGVSSRTAICSSAGQRAPKRLVGTGLDLPGAPQSSDRLRPQRVEQHGLADAAQSGEDEAALGPPSGHPLEHDVELPKLPVASGQLWWPLAGAWRIRVAYRIHDRTLWACLAESVDPARQRETACRAPGSPPTSP